MRKQIIASLGLGIALSGLGISNSAYAVEQAPIDITVQKLYYENKEDVNYTQDAAVVSPTQVWSKAQFGDVAFTLYKVDSALVGSESPVKVAQDIQDALVGNKNLPYGAKEYKGQMSIDDKGVVTFKDVEVGASYVVVETLHSDKVDLAAKPVFLRVDADKPGNIKVYLKNKTPKKEEPPKKEESPKKDGTPPPKEEKPKTKVQEFLAKTGLENYQRFLALGIVGFVLALMLVIYKLKTKSDRKK